MTKIAIIISILFENVILFCYKEFYVQVKLFFPEFCQVLKELKMSKVDYLTEFIPPLRRMNEISDEACVAMLRYSIYLMTYNNFMEGT